MQLEESSRLDLVGHPELRAALTFVRSQQQPPTADDLAAALDLPRSVARWRLERLVACGFLQPVFVRRTGRKGPGAGRPAKTYAIVPETEALEFPPRHFAQLLRRVLAALPPRGRRTRLREIGLAFGRDLALASALRPAARERTAADRICRALGRLGFHARVETASADEVVLVTATCPLRPLVVADETVRALDRGMWIGFVQSALRRRIREIRCTTHDCLTEGAPCRVVVQLHSR